MSTAASIVRTSPDGVGETEPTVIETTFLFSDVEGSTALIESLGDREAYALTQIHDRIVREQVEKFRGREIELRGDGFVLAFADPSTALLCAAAIQRELADWSRRYPDRAIRVRIGLHTGQAILDEVRVFGRTVVLAARIAAQANGGEILVSSQVRELAGERQTFLYDDVRELALKGLLGTHRLHRLDWRTTVTAPVKRLRPGPRSIERRSLRSDAVASAVAF